jgi:hypothetical protein
MKQVNSKWQCGVSDGKFVCACSDKNKIDDRITVQKYTDERGKNREFAVNSDRGVKISSSGLKALNELNKCLDEPLSKTDRGKFLDWADSEPFTRQHKKLGLHLGSVSGEKEDETEI